MGVRFITIFLKVLVYAVLFYLVHSEETNVFLFSWL